MTRNYSQALKELTSEQLEAIRADTRDPRKVAADYDLTVMAVLAILEAA